MAMPNGRVFAAAGSRASVTAFGARTYTLSPGTPLDVPVGDADALGANGWFTPLGAYTQVGPTSARPTKQVDNVQPLMVGTLYLDTTLGAVITWDGAAWRNVMTGAAV